MRVRLKTPVAGPKGVFPRESVVEVTIRNPHPSGKLRKTAAIQLE